MNDKQYTQEMVKNLNNRLKTKQEALTFDSTPTEGSVNPVTSEGIKAYVDASKGTTYTAGENITISQNNVISATDTTYTAGDNITISEDNVISSTTDVSGTNDGTNWTFLTINNNTKAIPQGVKIVDGFDFRFDKIEWSAPLSSPRAECIWTDGENTYYSYDSTHYVLDKSTSTWTQKTWSGLTRFIGNFIWTDGENIYYSSSLNSDQYVLDKSTSTWSPKTWTGLTNFDGYDVWTDGENIYYSNYGDHYVLNKSTSTWSEKTWTGLSYFYGEHIWTDGTNIYYSFVKGANKNDQYILNKETSAWSRIEWNSATEMAGYHAILGEDIWTDGENIYCFHSEHESGNSYYRFYLIFDKSILNWSTCGSAGLPYLNGIGNRGRDIWTDGDNIYYSYDSDAQYKLRHKYKTCQILAKVAETGDYNDLKNKPVVNPVLEGSEEKLIGIEVEDIQYKVPEVKVNNGFSNKWVNKKWYGLSEDESRRLNSGNVWTDGENVYYSHTNNNTGTISNYILNKSTSTWSPKTWSGLIPSQGYYIWTDGENIYYSNYSNQYVLDRSTSTWSTKTWNGFIPSEASRIWTDGENVYYSFGSSQYVLDKATSTWSPKTWTGLSEDVASFYVWTDGENVYYSNGSIQYVLDKATSTWSRKTWSGLTKFNGQHIWTDGENVYYSYEAAQYVLNKLTSTWTEKIWLDLTFSYGDSVWSDGENIYYSNTVDIIQKQLTFLYSEASILAKVAETGDYNDLKNIPSIPEEKTIYTYSISINKGADTITLINVQTSEALSNNLTFGDLINNIHLNTLAAEGGYTIMQGSLGFIDSKSDTQFTVSFANGNSYTFASTDTLTITTYLEQSRTFYSRN